MTNPLIINEALNILSVQHFSNTDVILLKKRIFSGISTANSQGIPLRPTEVPPQVQYLQEVLRILVAFDALLIAMNVPQKLKLWKPLHDENYLSLFDLLCNYFMFPCLSLNIYILNIYILST